MIHWSKPERRRRLISGADGSAQLAGAAPGLQIRCGALEPSRVGSIPMHFRHIFITITNSYIINQAQNPAERLPPITISC